MTIQFVQPETRRLPLKDNEWLLVRKKLNAGESRRLFSGVIRTMELGEKIQLDPERVGLQKLLVYLVDWSASERYPIRGKTSAEVAETINLLDPATYQELLQAVEQHETEMEVESTLEKKPPDGASESSATSTSAV